MLHYAPRRVAHSLNNLPGRVSHYGSGLFTAFGPTTMTKKPTAAQLIYNPHSGYRDWTGAVGRFVDFWKHRGWSVQTRSTEYPGHAARLAQDAVAHGIDFVFAAGGDGTLNEIANALVGTDTVLAPLPTGTANVFARELGLTLPNPLDPNWLLPVCRSLSRGRIQRMDVGQSATGRYWLLWASTGFDGYVVNQVEPRSRESKRWGKAGYFAAAISSVFRYRAPFFSVTVDDKTFEGEYVLINVSNCRMFLGGEFNLNRRGVLDDGVFEVWLFQGRDWSQLPIYAVDVTFDMHEKNPHVDVLRARYVAVETRPPLPYHLDGEPVAKTPFACQIVPRALRVMVPDTTPAGLFLEVGEPLPV